MIRRYIRKLLLEAMVPILGLRDMPIALWHTYEDYSDATKECFILYDPDKFFIKVEELMSPTYEYTSSALIDCMLGIIVTKSTPTYFSYDHKPKDTPCAGAVQVSLSAAKDGYGPTLYDLVMSYYPNGIYADRHSVSGPAETLWRTYYYSRPDIQKVFMDDYRKQYTDDPDDDCVGTHKVYSLSMTEEDYKSHPLNYYYKNPNKGTLRIFKYLKDEHEALTMDNSLTRNSEIAWDSFDEAEYMAGLFYEKMGGE
mgnify:CR=1 FL=1